MHLFFWVQREMPIQPDLEHRNLDFIVSFGLLDERILCSLPRFLCIIFPLRCLVAMFRSIFLICMQIESKTDPISRFFESHILCRSYWHNASS